MNTNNKKKQVLRTISITNIWKVRLTDNEDFVTDLYVLSGEAIPGSAFQKAVRDQFDYLVATKSIKSSISFDDLSLSKAEFLGPASGGLTEFSIERDREIVEVSLEDNTVLGRSQQGNVIALDVDRMVELIGHVDPEVGMNVPDLGTTPQP